MKTLFDEFSLERKIERSIETIKTFRPPEGIYKGAFSGGKDSVVLKTLAQMAGIEVEWHYSVTTVDPPEVIWFIRKHHPEVIFDRPKMPLWAMIRERGFPPTRKVRWCCDRYKEAKLNGYILVGIRAEESPGRAKRWGVVNRIRHRGLDQVIIAPILDWSERDVWQFHRKFKLPYCSLYDEGFKRIGCVMCPLAGTTKMLQEQKRWPSIARLWKKGIYEAWERRREKGKIDDEVLEWRTPEEMWEWWLKGPTKPKDDESEKCQGLGLFT